MREQDSRDGRGGLEDEVKDTVMALAMSRKKDPLFSESRERKGKVD